MSVEIAILFAMTEFLLSISPGPAVFLIISRSMHYGAKAGLRANFGVATANIQFYCLSAAGIGAVILASHQVFLVIKWAGAAYLVWLGLTMLWPALFGKPASAQLPVKSKPAARGRDFAHGFVVQASNPKNLVAFTAIIPQFVTPGHDIASQFLILALITLAVEIPILPGRFHRKRRFGRVWRTFQKRPQLGSGTQGFADETSENNRIKLKSSFRVAL